METFEIKQAGKSWREVKALATNRVRWRCFAMLRSGVTGNKSIVATDDVNSENAEDDVFDVETGVERICLEDALPDIPLWLQKVESPFNWLPVRFSDVPAKEVITKATERIQMDEGFDATFPFEKLVRILTLVYEYRYYGDEEKAWEQLISCEQLMAEEKHKDEQMYDELSGALTHILQATRTHLLYRAGKTTEAEQLVEGIEPVSSMDNDIQAAVQATKARFFYLYRTQGVKLAVHYAREALRLAPDKPLWQVLAAEAIRRLRKFLPSSEQFSHEEVPLLERAVKAQRNARHLVLLAQAYRERGDAIFKQHRSQPDFFQSQTFHEISDMQADAFELYKEALSLRPEDEVVNRLCGYGLLKLPAFKSDYRLAQRCLQKALEQSPNNPTTVHSLGLYYYKGLMEYEKAALFCEKAGKLGNFPASLDMLRMKRLVYGNNYDPVFDFGKLLQQYGDEPTKRHEVLCQMGSYYLFFERDLTKALKYFRLLIKENAQQSIMTSHKCTFLNMASKINLFECIVNEGTRLLVESENSSKDEMEENNLEDIQSFLDELQVLNPDLCNISLNTNLIDELHKVSDDIKQTYIRKKERRESYKEKQRSQNSSIDESPSSSRRQSESGDNRRRSSGNFSDGSNGWIYKSSNNAYKKQRSYDGSISLNSEFNQDGSTKKQTFRRSNSYQSGLSGGSFRRKNSGGASDLGRPSYNYKSQFPSRKISDIKEVFPPGERSHESNNSREMTFERQKSQSKRMSWSGNSSIEKVKGENWRNKD